MKPGDLVKHKLSESGMMGVVVKIEGIEWKIPVVLWQDGRCDECLESYLEVMNESR